MIHTTIHTRFNRMIEEYSGSRALLQPHASRAGFLAMPLHALCCESEARGQTDARTYTIIPLSSTAINHIWNQ